MKNVSNILIILFLLITNSTFGVSTEQILKGVPGYRLFEKVPQTLNAFGYNNCVPFKSGSERSEDTIAEMLKCSAGVYSKVSFNKMGKVHWGLGSVSVNLGPEAKTNIPYEIARKLLETLFDMVKDELKINCTFKSKTQFTKELYFDCLDRDKPNPDIVWAISKSDPEELPKKITDITNPQKHLDILVIAP